MLTGHGFERTGRIVSTDLVRTSSVTARKGAVLFYLNFLLTEPHTIVVVFVSAVADLPPSV